MALNKNGIFGIASLILTVLGIALVLLGVLKYTEYAIGFSVAGIGFISINRPQQLNALNISTIKELSENLKKVETDKTIKAVILSGEGNKAFVAGADIKEFANFSKKEGEDLARNGQESLFNLIEKFSKPVIAAVNGLALGGGFEVALAADIIVAAKEAVFGLPEPKIGAAAVAGGMHRLARQIGLKPAMGILLTADLVTAQEGHRLGFVNKVVPRNELMAAAVDVAEKIIQCAPLAIQATKQAVMEGLNTSNLSELQQAQKDGQFDRLEVMLQSRDIKEGLTAFMEKRKPQWQAK